MREMEHIFLKKHEKRGSKTAIQRGTLGVAAPSLLTRPKGLPRFFQRGEEVLHLSHVLLFRVPVFPTLNFFFLSRFDQAKRHHQTVIQRGTLGVAAPSLLTRPKGLMTFFGVFDPFFDPFLINFFFGPQEKFFCRLLDPFICSA